MCTQPILIRNKKLLSSVNVRNSFIKVPCGYCEECLRKRAKNLFVLARFEAEKTFLNGGCGFMCTLTYDNDNVPILEYDGKKYMVFNKKDVIKFIKRLRTKLDRLYLKHFGSLAPDFKYLVTAEFGTDPYKTHRPHYHLIILFEKFISLYYFRLCFQQCLTDSRTGKSYFGRIFQCDVLDMKRGGIRYSAKYILKDQTYNKQNFYIHELIKFYTHYVDSKHGINEFPESEDDFFKNRCIRSTKKYKKDIETYILPYRHMLQFYMCSNDFGCSAIIERYGECLYSLGVLNIDELPYSIPKQVIQRLERSQGSESRDIISKTIFLSQFRKCLEDVIDRHLITRTKGETLFQFCTSFVQPRYGCLYFVSPFTSYYASFTGEPLRDYDSLFEEFNFYDDNNFFALREEVLNVIGLSNSQDALEFRAASAYRKSERERERYLKRKFNKS